MSKVTIGLLTGLVLGIVAYFGGFFAFLVVAVFGAIGTIVGLFLEGRIDASMFSGRSSSRR